MENRKMFEDFLAAQKEFSALSKTVQGHGYRYADLGAVLDAVIPALHRHNLSLIQRTTPSENGVSVETVLVHVSGDTLSSGMMFMPMTADLRANVTQKFGAALTYARRYSAMTFLGLSAEDTDGVVVTGRNGYGREEERVAEASPAVKAAAEEAAKKGMNAYKEYWGSLDPKTKESLRASGLHDKFKSTAADVEASHE